MDNNLRYFYALGIIQCLADYADNNSIQICAICVICGKQFFKILLSSE